MLTSKEIIESEYLEARCALLEIGAMFDRYETAKQRIVDDSEDPAAYKCLVEALDLLAKSKSSTDRAEQLLHLFAKV